MKRRLFKFLYAFSLLLAVAMGALWVRSYSHTDHLGRWRRWEDRSLLKEECSGLVSQDGALVVVSFDRRFPSEFGSEGYGTPRNNSRLPKTFDHSGWLRDPLRWQEVRFSHVDGVFRFCGICYEHGFGGRGASFGESLDVRWLRVPFGFLVSAFLLWPLLVAGSHLMKKRRARIGTCRQCGYDLRATPERCPECGTATATPAR